MIFKKVAEEGTKSNFLQLARKVKTPKGKFVIIFLGCFFFLAISINPLNKAKNSVWADEPASIINLDQVVIPTSNTISLSESGVAVPNTSPLFVSTDTYASLMQFEDNNVESVDSSIIKYTVQKGETISQIAEKFNISVETILLSNELSSSKIKEGQELMILPVNGLIHMVEKDETVESIAKDYGVKPEHIAEFNNLNGDKDIYLGDILIIPNGKVEVAEPDKKPGKPSEVATKPKKAEYVDNDSVLDDVSSQISSAYFISPTKGTITQGSHYSYSSKGKNYYSAVDIGGDYGTPIVAAAGGTVQIAKNAWPYGMYITISHQNGAITLYSHLSSFAEGVISGANVSQGQIIGYMGNTGNVVRFRGGTGTHLHFEVRGGSNPLASFPVGKKISY
ncbi:MAG: LysM peptidoglycan-binding domain-containing protein [Candidatus Pacebacteria bacterium]|nr:LysM peptidoglycan-binding domain-containing protein [Candidatus Paceibacterota bacterium]